MVNNALVPLALIAFCVYILAMDNGRFIEVSLGTDQGQIRDHNEDFVTRWEPTNKQDEAENGWLYIVADGVGGADAGEVASQFASERMIEHYLNDHKELDQGQRLWRAMQAANSDLRQMVAERNDNSRMATTMVAAVFHDDHVYIGNVGDSRGYLWRNGRIRQITKDQSLVAKLVEEGAITEEEAFNHPRKNVILYSLGSVKDPQIDIFELPIETGDILLLCSDGLTRHVRDDELEAMLAQHQPNRATRILIDLANERGGEDNISAVVLHYDRQRDDNQHPATQKKTITTGISSNPAPSRMLLPYTILLTLVQTFLIILIWLLLQV